MKAVVSSETPVLEPVASPFTLDRKRFQEALPPHVPTMVVNSEGLVEFITAAGRHLLEYRPDQSMEPCFFSMVHAKNLYQVMRDVADMVCHGKPKATWLVRLRTGQGRWRWYNAAVRNDLRNSAILITLRDMHEW
jgi:hypothetical protein